ncbi:DNA topoisomerase IB [Novosphingobium colocasiae]|uniref:DNA topoisomerase n=1 Tax=Novosphingobium colocasiae TaxID=1256513 RepID=A0A918PAI1_9SPHN|nr:DNA topoisomerase IB [Novosphingobium colocasiae]GGY94258.1 DNA topoisomerase [Novosphingobium colocasiae]
MPPSALRFVEEDEPGITRKPARQRAGKVQWAYFAPDGGRITDRAEIDRLNAVALPPAYRDCWYACDPRSHLLATGIDARGRKQYRYHPEWREAREAMKFDRCGAFGALLPRLREQVRKDLGRRSLTRERAIASVITLLDQGAIRVGNECYARENRSFGATTLRRRHARLASGRLRLRFIGKGGKKHEIDCADRRLATCVRRMQDLPGQHLFQYLDAEGLARPVHSQDVNAYIADVLGEGFSAKHFRTWAASTIAFAHLHAHPGASLKAMLEDVCDRLGNTPAIARKSYVHPKVLAAATGEYAPALPRTLPRKTRWLSREERGLLAFLGEG